MATAWIKAGHSKPLWYGNPWVFPKSIEKIDFLAQAGDVVDVRDSKNQAFIGYGFYNPNSFFRIRILSRKADEPINANFFKKSIRSALSLRKGLYQEKIHTAFRLINGEGDFLPGFIADLYQDIVIIKLTSLGYYNFIPEITSALKSEIKRLCGVEIKAILNKVSAEEKQKEGIDSHAITIDGELDSEEKSIFQDGFSFNLRPLDMQKTGFYLDQRYNRLFLKNFTAQMKGLKVLDGYSYTGAFSHYIAGCASHIDVVDSSNAALDAAAKNFANNGIKNFVLTEEDATRFLKSHYGYDLIVLDPPKILKKKEHTTDALKKYVSVNETAALSLKSGGFLATFSCSGNITLQHFESAVMEGVQKSGKQFKVLYEAVNAPDHPFLISVPETAYLKFILLQVI